MKNIDYSFLAATSNFNNINKNVVLDCDEVLVNISIPWIETIISDNNFNKYINLKEYSKKDIYLRDEFYIEKFFTYKNKEDIEICKDKFYKIYSESRFYDNLKPTRYGTVMSKAAMQSFVENIYVITRHIGSNDNLDSKKLFLNKLFKNSIDKLNIIEIGKNEKKSDIIKDINNIAIYAEDELNNILDVIKNCKKNLDGTIINIPIYGYNKPNKELIDYSNDENNNFLINYYDPS